MITCSESSVWAIDELDLFHEYEYVAIALQSSAVIMTRRLSVVGGMGVLTKTTAAFQRFTL